jgi:hypothetical protein
MKITLNGMELSRRAEGSQTVGDVLTEVQAEIKRGGKIVTGVSLDSIPLPTGWKRRETLSSPVSNVQTLELSVDDPYRLLNQLLSDTEQMVLTLSKRSTELAGKFRIGDEVVANNDLAQYLDDLKQSLTGLDLLSRSSDVLPHPSRGNVMEAANQLLPTLDRIYKAQATSDYIAVADELEYELPLNLTACRNVLVQMKSLSPTTERR